MANSIYRQLGGPGNGWERLKMSKNSFQKIENQAQSDLQNNNHSDLLSTIPTSKSPQFRVLCTIRAILARKKTRNWAHNSAPSIPTSKNSNSTFQNPTSKTIPTSNSDLFTPRIVQQNSEQINCKKSSL